MIEKEPTKKELGYIRDTAIGFDKKVDIQDEKVDIQEEKVDIQDEKVDIEELKLFDESFS